MVREAARTGVGSNSRFLTVNVSFSRRDKDSSSVGRVGKWRLR